MLLESLSIPLMFGLVFGVLLLYTTYYKLMIKTYLYARMCAVTDLVFEKYEVQPEIL